MFILTIWLKYINFITLFENIRIQNFIISTIKRNIVIILIFIYSKIVPNIRNNRTDFEDGDQLQIRIDGKTYLVHSSNVVLISN